MGSRVRSHATVTYVYLWLLSRPGKPGSCDTVSSPLHTESVITAEQIRRVFGDNYGVILLISP